MLNRFEDVRNVGLKGCKGFLVQLDEARTEFLHVSDYLADSWYEELGLYVGEDLEDILTLFGILHNALC